MEARKRGADLRAGIQASYELWQKLFKDAIRQSGRSGWLTVDVLGEAGKPVTPEGILAYYRGLKVRSSDALLFYYIGHGAWDRGQGQFLAMSGGDLLRTDVRNAMIAKKPFQMTVMTNCCSSYIAYRPAVQQGQGEQVGGVPGITTVGEGDCSYPVVRRGPASPRSATPKEFGSESGVAATDADVTPFFHLFLQHGGIVDFTAATEGQIGWGNILTSAFINLVYFPVADLDENGDGFVHWSEFFPKVQQTTREWFVYYRDHAAEKEEIRKAADQTPQAFNLAYWPQYLRNFKMVNRSREKLRVRVQYYAAADEGWQWFPDAERSEWLTYTIPPGKSLFLTVDSVKIQAFQVCVGAHGLKTGRSWQPQCVQIAPLYGDPPGKPVTYTYTFNDS